MWDNNVWEGFKSRVNGFTWHMTGVYAPTCNLERQEVWWEIGAVRSLFAGPWVLGGDFNIVRYALEKRNCSRTSVYMNDFSDVIEDMELIDPPLERGNYTWARGSNLEAVSRIDRIIGRWSHTKSYFKFEGWWLEIEGFNERIKDWWTSFEFEGRHDFILASKLKAMKTKLKDWSVSIYGNLEKRKKEMLNKVHEFDEIQQSRPLTKGETLQKASVEEIAWRQRSRTLWIKQGDKNTKFFQRMANAHKRFNHIDKLVVGDQELVDPIDIKTEIIYFYRKLYKESENWRPSFHMNQCTSISFKEQQELQKPFEEEEVLLGLKVCVVDKAPGPDGYTMGYFILFWDDNWLGNGSLKQLFPDIYLLNQQHEATVQEVWSIHGWNLTYRRRIQDWEVDRLTEFYGTLDHFGGLKEGEDTLRWTHHSKGSGSTNQSRWRIVPAVIWWTIWRERNMRCFESSSSPLHRIKMNCIITFCYWCSLEYVDDPIAVRDILGPL
ncbi:hypothetical protein H5410_022792 [Solanum commersonii]|uniref:Reverse transcriptase n=1 Tax=Solanum commersonii TaxID=4109 RepID=A0A9J5ZHT2_SOLCO|nr:hypothetical protein H5410_022792 [Solanum commersonii]